MQNPRCLIDLHIHLDGAISLQNAKALAKLQNIKVPEDAELLRQLSVEPDCKDLTQFLEKFALPCSLLKTREGLRTGVYNLCKELEEGGIIYTEIRFAPQLCTSEGFNMDDAVRAAIEGMRESGMDGSLILCAMRGSKEDEALAALNRQTADLVAKYLGRGVCAFDLAGAEALFNTENYKELFEYAKSLNIPYTIHAGEADGPKSVQNALSFGAYRIGHGVRSLEDPEVFEELVLNKVPMELCPTSNIQTCIFKELSEYPIKKILSAGAIATINTDDPGIEGTNLWQEFEKLQKHCALTDTEIKTLLLNSARSAFCSEAHKSELAAKIEAACK